MSESLPPASIEMLVSMLATQVLLALGQIPGDENEEPKVDLVHAKHLIDTLDVLQDKTKGNLTPSEATMLERVLHQLRMMFVSAQ